MGMYGPFSFSRGWHGESSLIMFHGT